MSRLRYPLLASLLAAGPSGGQAQLRMERSDGLSRICSYAGSANVVTGQLRSVRIGIGQNCPITHPDSSSDLPAPPTAQLHSDTVEGAERRCVYEQAGTIWSFVQSVAQPCPLYAGMVRLAPGRQPSLNN